MRPIKQRIHYSKQGAPKGFPWTVHNSRGCFSLSSVSIEVPAETENRPELKTNPRYFIVCRGHLVVDPITGAGRIVRDPVAA